MDLCNFIGLTLKGVRTGPIVFNDRFVSKSFTQVLDGCLGTWEMFLEN